MKRSLAVLAAIVLAVLGAAPASAATRTVQASDDLLFHPGTIGVALGTHVHWHNNSSSLSHTSTQDSPLALWDTGTIAVGETKGFEMKFAGAFPYHCQFHGGNGGAGMSGTVRVPVMLSATSVAPGTTVTITLATVHAPDFRVYDVQKRVDTGVWTKFARGYTKKTIDFTTDTPGTYAFRSRFRHRGNGGQSGYSPFRTVTVVSPG
jgi:plastocyanin